jgi:predicted transcriptional regulator
MAGKGKPGPLTKEEALHRRTEIWRMRVAAHTVQEIADHFGITHQRVSQLLKEHGGEISQQAAEELRKVELDKLDIMERAAREVVARHQVEDDPTLLAAIDRVLKVQQRRAALTGLDAPVKQEVTSYAYTVNGVDPEALK